MWNNRFLIPLLLMFGVVVLSCNRNSKFSDKMIDFCSKTIVIPSDKMERRFCSFYSDTAQYKKKWHYYTYIDGADCQSCEIGKIALNEQSNKDKVPQLEFSYIVRVPKTEIEYVYRKFCNARIEGTLYLDTCDAFRIANPHFPDLKVFHAFVLDRYGRVMFVGHPFQNERMEKLFFKVIDKETRSKKYLQMFDC